MAVIIRTRETDKGGKTVIVKHFRSIKPPTQRDTHQAKALDEYLKQTMRTIKDKLKKEGVLERRQGDLARWHALGREIANFIDNPKIVPPEDRIQDRYIWIAIGQHAPTDLHPGKEIGNSKNVGTHRDHFRLCYLLAKLQPDYKKAEVQGTWRDWVTLLESKFVLQDQRILTWIREKLDNSTGAKLRPLSKVLRQGLKNVHTDVLTDEELEAYMEQCWKNLLSEEAAT